MKEIERKFLVNSEAYKKQAFNRYTIKQGFLNSDKHRTVRIRLKANKAYITVKGISSKDGTERFEWEKEIDFNEAEQLLELCELPLIIKSRYEVEFSNHLFEIDEFYEENEGLVVAEIELKHKHESFIKPKWLGDEVTGDLRYYNSNLIKRPYKTWS